MNASKSLNKLWSVLSNKLSHNSDHNKHIPTVSLDSLSLAEPDYENGVTKQDNELQNNNLTGEVNLSLSDSCEHNVPLNDLPIANQDPKQSLTDNDMGVNNLANTNYSFLTNQDNFITSTDYKEINQRVKDKVGDSTSMGLNMLNQAALKEQCPITNSSLWQQVVGHNGKAQSSDNSKLTAKEGTMLPELDPMKAGNHAYQLVHNLYNICNEGYLRFDALSEGELIRANQGEISTLIRRIDGSAQELNCYLIPLIKAMVRCCSVIPASLYSHHDDCGGLIRHNLQIANECIECYRNFAHSKITVANTIATLTEQREMEKQAQEAYLSKLNKQSQLEKHVKKNLEAYKASIGLKSEGMNDLLNLDLDVEMLNGGDQEKQKYSAIAKDMQLMIEKSLSDSSLESLAELFDHDSEEQEDEDKDKSEKVKGVLAKKDRLQAFNTVNSVKDDPSMIYKDEVESDLDNWESLHYLQRAQAFGLITYVEDEQLALLSCAYSKKVLPDNFARTNKKMSGLEQGRYDHDPYLVGLANNLIGATSNDVSYELELEAMRNSLFENAFVQKIGELNLSNGSFNDYNSTITKQKKDVFSNLISQIRIEAQENNVGRFDRYQLDLIAQLTIIFVAFAHDLGKIINDMEIFNDRGERFNPHLETIANFAEQTQTKYLYVRYISSRAVAVNNHKNSTYSGVHLLSVMCPDLVAQIYQLFNLDTLMGEYNHPLNQLIARMDSFLCASNSPSQNLHVKGFVCNMVVELVKTRLRADALAQMQIARIQSLAKKQNLDLSGDYDLKAVNPEDHRVKPSDYDNLWQEVKHDHANEALKNNIKDQEASSILDDLLKENKPNPTSTNQAIHPSVNNFREQMNEEAPIGSTNLYGQPLYHMDPQKQQEAEKSKRLKQIKEEQYRWAMRIFKSSRHKLSVNEIGSDLYVEGNTVLIEQGSRALSTLNFAYQTYCYGPLSEHNNARKGDFKQHLQIQKLSETYMSLRDYSWFAIAVGEDLVLLRGIDLRLMGCDFGSDVAIINLGTNCFVTQEFPATIANYVLAMNSLSS